jgi:hypothetical protein
MYSTPIDLSFSYCRSAVEASLDIKKVQVEPNNYDLFGNIYNLQFTITLAALWYQVY